MRGEWDSESSDVTVCGTVTDVIVTVAVCTWMCEICNQGIATVHTKAAYLRAAQVAFFTGIASSCHGTRDSAIGRKVGRNSHVNLYLSYMPPTLVWALRCFQVLTTRYPRPKMPQICLAKLWDCMRHAAPNQLRSRLGGRSRADLCSVCVARSPLAAMAQQP